jgi:hypothetical protein
MTKLFKLDNDVHETFWCFAPDKKTASNIVAKQCLKGHKKSLKAEDVTSKHIKEDGVEYLINHNFIGIPKKLNFMLNGSMSAMVEHYDTQKRSGILWYSEKVPGSREIWA